MSTLSIFTRYATLAGYRLWLPSDKYIFSYDTYAARKSWELRLAEDLAALTGALPGEF